MGGVMKNYLSQREKDIWLIVVLAVAELEDALPKMKTNLTKEEHKCLKTSITLTRKAYNSMSERIGINGVKQLHKYASNSNIEVVTKSLSNAIAQREVKEKETTIIETEILRKLGTMLVASKCEGCRDDYRKCNTFTMLDVIGLTGYCENNNCPYSFAIEEEKKVKKISKRKQKKEKNKYDDTDDIYKYNFDRKSVE